MRLPTKLVGMGKAEYSRQRYQALLGAGLVLLLAAVTLIAMGNTKEGGEGGVHRRLLSKVGVESLLSAVEECKAAPQFLDYTPSAWEQEWFERAQEFQDNPTSICKAMLEEGDRTKAWLAVTTPSEPGERFVDRFESGQAELDTTVFSRMQYRNPCTGEEYSAFIEPLVGHFRHPHAPRPCTPKGARMAIEDRSYVLFAGLSKQQFAQAHQGKKYFFDLGTARFKTSIPWFLNKLDQYGHKFDEIWAWEIKFQEPKRYWGNVPDDVLPRLHFYNVPVSGGEELASNPLNIIRSKYQPGDYVFVKLDIDNSPLELSFIDQIERDPELISMISEITFEMHYDHPDMAVFFGRNNKKDWIDVINRLTSLRRKGLRIHYWP